MESLVALESRAMSSLGSAVMVSISMVEGRPLMGRPGGASK